MTTWYTQTLGEVADKTGGTIRTGPFGSQLHQSDYVDAGVPVVMPQDLIDGQVSTANVARITEETAERLAHHRMKPGDIVYARRGDIGRRALIRENQNGWFCGTGCLRISLGEKVINPLFLHYYLSLPDVITLIANQAVGATMPNLNTSILRGVPITFPPLETQQQIAAILSAYDDLIENNTRRIKVLEEMAGLIYREWFVNFRFPGHEGVRLVASEFGEIPEGWRAVKLGDIAEQIRRSVQPDDVSKDTPYIGLEHLPRKSIALSNWAFLDSVTSSKLRFYQGEILFGKIRPYFHKVGVAPVNGICSSDIIVIRPKNPEFAALTAMVTSSEDFVLQSVQTSQGTKMPRANWDVLVKYPVFLPDNDLLERFNGIAANIISQIRNYVFKNQNLRRTRDLLLPKLISGELSVSQLEINPEDAQDLVALRAAKAAEGDSPTVSLDELKAELGLV